MEFKLKIYPIHQLGERKNQEDSIYPLYDSVNNNDRLFIVCDGMGGHDSGEVASQTVCEAMSSCILSKDKFDDTIFEEALSSAYASLDEKDTGAEKKMGTTLAFLKLHDKGATIAHIGDSRVYHIRPGVNKEKTQILYVTSDHSLVNDLIKVGELTPEEAKHSRQKNIITRAMQPNMEHRSKADLYSTEDILPGDYFYLCSDGMLEEMDDENIKFVFSDEVTAVEKKVKMLLDLSKDYKDNHSAFVILVTDVEKSLSNEVLDVDDKKEILHKFPIKKRHIIRRRKSSEADYDARGWKMLWKIMIILTLVIILFSVYFLFLR